MGSISLIIGCCRCGDHWASDPINRPRLRNDPTLLATYAQPECSPVLYRVTVSVVYRIRSVSVHTDHRRCTTELHRKLSCTCTVYRPRTVQFGIANLDGHGVNPCGPRSHPIKTRGQSEQSISRLSYPKVRTPRSVCCKPYTEYTEMVRPETRESPRVRHARRGSVSRSSVTLTADLAADYACGQGGISYFMLLSCVGTDTETVQCITIGGQCTHHNAGDAYRTHHLPAIQHIKPIPSTFGQRRAAAQEVALPSEERRLEARIQEGRESPSA